MGLVSLASVAGVIVAYFRVSLAQATIATLKESNDALRERNAEIDALVIQMEARLLVLEGNNRVLREAVSGKESNQHVIDAVNHHHAEVMADRLVLGDRLTESALLLGQKVDANHRSILDILTIIGHQRSSEKKTV